jgi:hypothetical protein
MDEPLPLVSAHLKTIADLPSALVDDVCFGMATLPEIFTKYGYTPESAEVFREDKMFKRLVAVRSAELDKEGITHKVRAGMVADSALTALALRVRDPNTNTSLLLDTYKAVSKNAGLEPRGPELPSAGSGFSVVFNIVPPGVPRAVPVEIDITPTRVFQNNDAEFEVE